MTLYIVRSCQFMLLPTPRRFASHEHRHKAAAGFQELRFDIVAADFRRRLPMQEHFSYFRAILITISAGHGHDDSFFVVCYVKMLTMLSLRRSATSAESRFSARAA